MSIRGKFGFKTKPQQEAASLNNRTEEMAKLTEELGQLKKRKRQLEEDTARERHPADAGLLSELSQKIRQKEERLKQLAEATL